MIVRVCSGCGALLQDTDEKKAGFVPVLKEDTVYCKRCFKLKHYNELPKLVASLDAYQKVIEEIKNKNALFIYVVDIFNFYDTFKEEIFKDLIGKDIFVVVNKIDLLPQSINVNDILNFVSHECERHFLKVLAIHLVSAKKGYYLEDLMHNIDAFRRERDVYVLGMANVGKSSFINSILKKETSRTDDLITTSLIQGTTLKAIRIPFFEDNQALIDTPGLINPSDVINYLDIKDYKRIIPAKEVKAITYQLFGNYTYFINDFIYFEFINIDKASLTFYIEDKELIKRVKNENIDSYLKKVKSLIKLDNKTYNTKYLEVNGKKLIYFPGYGFAYLNGKCKVKIHYLAKLGVMVYDKFFRK